jgi:hypothetical protein
MNDDRTGKRRPTEQREHGRALQAQEERRAEGAPQQKKKPSPIEEREWRGSGVCGDRHTD